jgi:hypothetical protein
MHRVAEIRRLLPEVDSTGFSYFVQSFNHSDDLFRYRKRPLPPSLGVEPAMRYSVSLDIEFLLQPLPRSVGTPPRPPAIMSYGRDSALRMRARLSGCV